MILTLIRSPSLTQIFSVYVHACMYVVVIVVVGLDIYHS